MSHSFIDSLKWRYATKSFDTDKKVSAEDIRTLKESINLTATSFGLQPFRVMVIDDPALKTKLRAASWDQPQLEESSHVFVFASKLDMTAEYIDDFVRRTAATRELSYEALSGYGDFMKNSIAGKDPEFIQDWNRRQAYIALGTLLAAAAELRIDACPMEGFDPAQYDELLGLKEKGLTAAVIAPVGYRSAEDPTQHAAKVRLPLEEIFL